MKIPTVSNRRPQDPSKANAQLGWLLDPQTRRVEVYRPDGTVEELAEAEMIAGNPVLPGFTLDLRLIWESDF